MMSKNLCVQCGKCCRLTEMYVSTKDISRILKNFKGCLQKEDFVEINQDGTFQLKNVENWCYFYDIENQLCKIYEFRPRGCRFYPLIYDMEDNKCILDEECPRSHLFYEKSNKTEKICIELKKFLEKELFLKLKEDV